MTDKVEQSVEITFFFAECNPEICVEETKPEMPSAPLTSESIASFLQHTNSRSLVHTTHIHQNQIKLQSKPLNTRTNRSSDLRIRFCFLGVSSSEE